MEPGAVGLAGEWRGLAVACRQIVRRLVHAEAGARWRYAVLPLSVVAEHRVAGEGGVIWMEGGGVRVQGGT